MKLIRKQPSEYYKDYELPTDVIDQLEKEILAQGEEVNGDEVAISENIPNKHLLTPRHITENFENVIVKLYQMTD